MVRKSALMASTFWQAALASIIFNVEKRLLSLSKAYNYHIVNRFELETGKVNYLSLVTHQCAQM
jgi:hypothetical protein